MIFVSKYGDNATVLVEHDDVPCGELGRSDRSELASEPPVLRFEVEEAFAWGLEADAGSLAREVGGGDGSRDVNEPPDDDERRVEGI